jgi:D-alanyl-lipoteichoic acid acyltransferase DltB (MBOAT superfamily)
LIFPTVQFAAFFAVVLPISWLLMPYRRAWKLFLIAASYYFYASADWHFVFLLAGCTLWNQLWAKVLAVEQADPYRRIIVGVAIVGDLGILGWFKYYGFFVANVVSMTHSLGLPMPLPLVQVALPIGISFFTFQAISYVMDVYRRQISPVATLDFAVFLSFFPHLIAGPIVRVRELVPQFATPRDPKKIEFSRAIGLISGGLIKKILIADTVATQLVDPVFANPGLHSRVDVIAAIYGYATQIYCDFSAYSDIAIGLALLMGYQFPPNFNRPYAAVSLTEFWHRWHMTLSRWLRDYVYIPLGGNRKGRKATYRNLMLTMLLGGLWHGAAWNFVLWGGLHGSGLAAERWWDERRGTMEVKYRLARWLLTFNFVCFAWVFFRADGMGNVEAILHQLTVSGGQTTVTTGVLLAILTGIGIQFIPQEPRLVLRRAYARLGTAGQALTFAGVVLVAEVFVSGQGVAPFIYYRF